MPPVEAASLSDDMTRAIDILNEREKTVITHYFGIGSERHTMAEIGEKMNLKRERVRQIRNQAVRKLRKAVKED